MCSSTICSWSSFAADHRDTMENPHVPKGVCVTLGTYDALYARLYCRLEMCGKGASVYCLIASRLDYTETRRTQGLWIQLPGRRGWAMFDHLKSRSVDTFLLVWVQVRKGLNEGPIYWMSVWLQLTFTRCRGLWMPWSMVDVICMIQHDPTLLKGTGWLMRTRAMRMWLQRMSSAVADRTARGPRVVPFWRFVEGSLETRHQHASTCRDLSTDLTTVLLILPLNSFADRDW